MGPEFGVTDPTALRLIAQGLGGPVAVTQDKIYGLPTVAECIRQAANMVARLDVKVYDETAGVDNRIEAKNLWQWKLFRSPSLDNNKFNFYADISSGIDGYGNAFAQKIRGTGRKYKNQIVELRIIHPDKVRVYRDDSGEKKFDVKFGPRDIQKGLTSSDILHFRGFTIGGGVAGLSLIKQYNAQFTNIIGIQEFIGRYWANDAQPGGYISLPEETSDLDKTALEEILEMWTERHGGVGNKHRPGILKGGAKFESLPIDAASVQMIEGQRYNVEEIARMMDWPVEMIQPSAADTGRMEELNIRLRTYYVEPRCERIRSTFNEDPDLFGDPGGPINMDFDYNKMQVANTIEQANADMRMVQGGINTPNEIRARRGYPSRPDGDILYPPAGVGSNGNAEPSSGVENGVDSGTGSTSAKGAA